MIYYQTMANWFARFTLTLLLSACSQHGEMQPTDSSVEVDDVHEDSSLPPDASLEADDAPVAPVDAPGVCDQIWQFHPQEPIGEVRVAGINMTFKEGGRLAADGISTWVAIVHRPVTGEDKLGSYGIPYGSSPPVCAFFDALEMRTPATGAH